MPLGAAADAQHANNFDFIRWLAASMVLVSHEYAVLGRGGEEPLGRLSHGFATLGTIGVDVFFVVSGCLIAQSLARRGDLRYFYASRVLRIVPGLFVALVVSAFVIGALATTLPMADYLRDRATWSYVTHGVTLRNLQWTLPGVFESLPYPRVVNGSLWSLWPEVEMYLAVGGLGWIAVSLGASRRVVLAAGMALIALGALAQHPDLAGRAIEPTTLARLAPLFAFGALLGLAPWRARFAWMGFAIAAAVAYVARGTLAFVPAFDVALALAVLLLARTPIPPLDRWGRYGDWSYGIYVYAFPVQQLVVYAFPGLSLPAHLALAYPSTVLLGALSWHLVEAPALAAKGLVRRKRAAAVEPSLAGGASGAGASGARAPRAYRSSSS